MMRFFFSLVLLSLCVGCSKESDTAVSFEDEIQLRVEAYMNAQADYFEALPEDRYHALIKQLASEHPRAIEFRELYPKAYQVSGRTLAHVGPLPELSESGAYPDQLRLVAPLYGRYQLTCVIPFYLSSDFKSVAAYGEPYFHLLQYDRFEQKPSGGYSVSSRSVEFLDGNFRFDVDDWELFKRNNCDWSKVGVGPWVRTDAPWPYFEEYCLMNAIP